MKLKDFKAAYRVTVKGLVCDRAGRLIFVRERGETWDLPGGGLEHGEGLHEALRREFREELDAEIEILAGFVFLLGCWVVFLVVGVVFVGLVVFGGFVAVGW